MNLIYLSSHNLSDTFFMKSFVANYKIRKPTLILHDHFGRTPADTWFVTKRVSSLLSENMIVNNAFAGDQRGIFSLEGESLRVNAGLLQDALRTVQLVILNPMVRAGETSVPGDADALLQVLRTELVSGDTILFPSNIKSPLGAQRTLITGEEQRAQLAALYEEELEAIDRAIRLRPAVLATPGNFST